MFFVSSSFAQENDYTVYSKILNRNIGLRNNNGDDLVRVEVRKRCDCNKELRELAKSFNEGIAELGYFDESMPSSVDKSEFHKALEMLVKSRAPKINSDLFQTQIEVNSISRNGFRRFFRNDDNDGWGRFYKKYEQSAGLYSFSKVVYSGSLALVYWEMEVSHDYGGGLISILLLDGTEFKYVHDVLVWIR